jgi:hypothetical protein
VALEMANFPSLPEVAEFPPFSSWTAAPAMGVPDESVMVPEILTVCAEATAQANIAVPVDNQNLSMPRALSFLR